MHPATPLKKPKRRSVLSLYYSDDQVIGSAGETEDLQDDIIRAIPQ